MLLKMAENIAPIVHHYTLVSCPDYRGITLGLPHEHIGNVIWMTPGYNIKGS